LRAATWPFYETVWILTFYWFINLGRPKAGIAGVTGSGSVKKLTANLGGMGFFEDHSRISIACCGRRFISHRPGPSIAAAGNKGTVAV
jgi:hypothetical protein